MFRILTTAAFDDDFRELDAAEQQKVKKKKERLKEQGDSTGDPLTGLSFFREKRVNGKRIYYLIYKQYAAILLLCMSDKKTQQATINKILRELAQYQQYVEEKLRKNGFI